MSDELGYEGGTYEGVVVDGVGEAFGGELVETEGVGVEGEEVLVVHGGFRLYVKLWFSMWKL